MDQYPDAVDRYNLSADCPVDEPVALMVAMLQSAGPPMINLAVMAGLAGGDVSTDCAGVLLVTYAASVVSWTVAISGFLALLHDEF